MQNRNMNIKKVKTFIKTLSKKTLKSLFTNYNGQIDIGKSETNGYKMFYEIPDEIGLRDGIYITIWIDNFIDPLEKTVYYGFWFANSSTFKSIYDIYKEDFGLITNNDLTRSKYYHIKKVSLEGFSYGTKYFERYAGYGNFLGGYLILRRHSISELSRKISIFLKAKLNDQSFRMPDDNYKTSFNENEKYRIRELITFKRDKSLRRNALKKWGYECAVCKKDISKYYNKKIAENIIEIHHLKPLSENRNIVRTTLKDVASVCANCHNIIHSKAPALTIKQAKKLISKQAS